MGTIFKNILQWVTDTRNTRLILFAGIMLLVFLLLRQCNATKNAAADLELQKQETQRIQNNLIAAQDTLEQWQYDADTWRAEKKGFSVKMDELKDQYKGLLGDFVLNDVVEPKTLIQTEVIFKDRIVEVPVFITNGDSIWGHYLAFSDSAKYNGSNFRYLTGRIPFNYNYSDSTVVAGNGSFTLEQGMNLNLGLFRDKKTKEISIMVDTDYPGLTFTKLEGAYILDDPKNQPVIRSMRKTMGIGLSLGYGAMYNINTKSIGTGPYIGVGINYQPKFLQW